MLVKVGQALSGPRLFLGGVPQGSILRVYLFNATIDSFEAGSKDVRQCDVVGGTPGRAQHYIQHNRSHDSPVEQVYNRPGFKAWEAVPLVVLKSVDDNIIIEKFCFDTLVIGPDGNKNARPARSENLSRQIF